MNAIRLAAGAAESTRRGATMETQQLIGAAQVNPGNGTLLAIFEAF